MRVNPSDLPLRASRGIDLCKTASISDVIMSQLATTSLGLKLPDQQMHLGHELLDQEGRG